MPEPAPMFRSKSERRRPKRTHGFDHGKSTTARGYGYPWQKIRKRILERDGHLCQAHLRRGIYRNGRQVDHILAKALGGTDYDDNLETLCDPCHKAKTAEDNRKVREAGA